MNAKQAAAAPRSCKQEVLDLNNPSGRLHRVFPDASSAAGEFSLLLLSTRFDGISAIEVWPLYKDVRTSNFFQRNSQPGGRNAKQFHVKNSHVRLHFVSVMLTWM